MRQDYMIHDQVEDDEVRRAFNHKDRAEREAFLRNLLIRMKK